MPKQEALATVATLLDNGQLFGREHFHAMELGTI